MRRKFTREDALTVQKKLGGELDTSGRNHDGVRIFNCGKLVARYGIRRSSKDVGHGHLPKGLRIPQAKVWQLVRCTLSKAAYFELLKEHDDLHRQVGSAGGG